MRISITVIFLISMLWAHAQSGELIIQGQTGGLYLEHTVAPKETWYSVGRMYNIDPKALAQYNHLTFAHPLVIGEAIKVPLNAGNFNQNGKKLANESLVPVYHIVQDKEWLYRISVNHNKVPIPELEKWNHVTGDQVHPGLHMIVGYLKVKTALSALAKGAKAPVAGSGATGGGATGGATGGAAVQTGGGTTGGGTVQAGGGASAGGAKDTPVVEKSVNSPVTEKAKEGTKVARRMTDTVAPTPVVGSSPAVVKSPAAVVKSSPVPFAGSSPAPQFNGGKFKADFTDGGKLISGLAGIFKSSSGWQDGKYYALINNVPVGTIVKISDQSTGKSVFAKVLGQLPEMKESAGLTVRLSNAAAAELGEGDGKFNVGVSY